MPQSPEDRKMPLTLGPLERSHLPLLQVWRNHPSVQAHVRHPGLVSMADQEEWFERARHDLSTVMFAVLRISGGIDDGLRGVAGLCHIDPANRSAELSVIVMRGGQPYLAGEREIAQQLCRKAFDMGLHRVWAECFLPSRCDVFANAGLKKMACIPQTTFRNGQWLDSTYFSLLESEWRGVQRP